MLDTVVSDRSCWEEVGDNVYRYQPDIVMEWNDQAVWVVDRRFIAGPFVCSVRARRDIEGRWVWVLRHRDTHTQHSGVANSVDGALDAGQACVVRLWAGHANRCARNPFTGLREGKCRYG